MAYEVVTTEEFDGFLDGLSDAIAREAIAARLVRLSAGNFGDYAPVGGGVSELRIHHGAGFRAYYTMQGRTIVVMLCGGTKRTQRRDIDRAKRMAAEL